MGTYSFEPHSKITYVTTSIYYIQDDCPTWRKMQFEPSIVRRDIRSGSNDKYTVAKLGLFAVYNSSFNLNLLLNFLLGLFPNLLLTLLLVVILDHLENFLASPSLWILLGLLAVLLFRFCFAILVGV
jgi:hypothetical protein